VLPLLPRRTLEAGVWICLGLGGGDEPCWVHMPTALCVYLSCTFNSSTCTAGPTRRALVTSPPHQPIGQVLTPILQ
jgi:hypothetical protein